MMEERLTEAERILLLRVLFAQTPRNGPVPPLLLRLISLMSGTDTTVICERAYPAYPAREAG
jgi:hypothetical protein